MRKDGMVYIPIATRKLLKLEGGDICKFAIEKTGLKERERVRHPTSRSAYKKVISFQY